MKKVLMLILIIVGCSVSETKAQKVALKSNLLYDATATMNLGLEFGLARKWTLDIPVNYHPWKPADGKRLRHWGVQPEVRYCGGVSIGHSWILKKRWSLEASVGVGYARIVYDKYPCTQCGTKEKEDNKNYFGPTKASVSLIYVIK